MGCSRIESLLPYPTGQPSHEDSLGPRKVKIDFIPRWEEWHCHIAKGHVRKEGLLETVCS